MGRGGDASGCNFHSISIIYINLRSSGLAVLGKMPFHVQEPRFYEIVLYDRRLYRTDHARRVPVEKGAALRAIIQPQLRLSREF